LLRDEGIDPRRHASSRCVQHAQRVDRFEPREVEYTDHPTE